MNWAQLQTEHKVWVDAAFPNQPPELPALCMVEEAGELLHALLKMDQTKVYGKDRRYTEEELRAKAVDAVGDCVISACSFCNTRNWAFTDFVRVVRATVTPLEGSVSLIRCAVDFMQCAKLDGYWSPAFMARYLSILYSVADSVGINYESAAEAAWQVVKERKR